MKSFQEKEKKLYELLNKLNNFDVSQIQNKDKLEIENLKDHKNQLNSYQCIIYTLVSSINAWLLINDLFIN